MGNWRTVNIEGKMNPNEAKEMISLLSKEYAWRGKPYSCLAITEGLCGIGQWIDNSGNIYARGNLAERDYDNDDIEKALKFLAEKFPSIELVLHSGEDWESLDCSATFHVGNGTVIKCDPEIERLDPIFMNDRELSDRLIGSIYKSNCQK